MLCIYKNCVLYPQVTTSEHLALSVRLLCGAVLVEYSFTSPLERDLAQSLVHSVTFDMSSGARLNVSPSPRPSRVSAILAHKCRLANEAGNSLSLGEVRERMLREELKIENPSLPEEGKGCSEVAELEEILRDVHNRYEFCATSVKDAITQAESIDATTIDPDIRSETRANLIDLREKMFQLRQDRSRAETNLRNHPGFNEFNSLLALLLEAERESSYLREVLEELQAENDLVLETLNSYAEHTHLKLSRRIHNPRVPAFDDGRRCEMCDHGFPANEVQISPCGHFYHLFCLAIRVAIYPDCSRQSCREPFPPCWLRNFGFPSFAESESSTDGSSDTSSSGRCSNGANRCLLKSFR